MENEKTILIQKLSKLESQKDRLESIFKTNMKSNKLDLLDEV